jgi:hypothetical protein
MAVLPQLKRGLKGWEDEELHDASEAKDRPETQCAHRRPAELLAQRQTWCLLRHVRYPSRRRAFATPSPRIFLRPLLSGLQPSAGEDGGPLRRRTLQQWQRKGRANYQGGGMSSLAESPRRWASAMRDLLSFLQRCQRYINTRTGE